MEAMPGTRYGGWCAPAGDSGSDVVKEHWDT
eukprot:COSAG01_NODE_23525_length_812_cov_0.684432_1_plen_30_part_10